jgi:hypothetical protein
VHSSLTQPTLPTKATCTNRVVAIKGLLAKSPSCTSNGTLRSPEANPRNYHSGFKMSELGLTGLIGLGWSASSDRVELRCVKSKPIIQSYESLIRQWGSRAQPSSFFRA